MSRTHLYIAGVAVSAFGITSLGYARYGLTPGPELFVLPLLAAVQIVIRNVVVDTKINVSFGGILLLAAQAMLGPAGAGVVGLLVGLFQGSRLPARARLFNASQLSLIGAVGGFVFVLTGGTVDPSALTDLRSTGLLLAGPIFLADVTQFVLNILLLTGVVRISTGAPVRAQAGTLVATTGLSYLGYGVIAFLLVVLWKPAGLGPTAAALVLAPLLVAQWVYRQRADELEGQQRALGVLVAALEAKAPHLAGHSARVAELSGHMAEGLGLSPQQVADTRMAGMLHDVGQTSLPTRQVRALDLTDPGTATPYPETGAAILEDLTFLRGALDPIRQHRAAATTPGGAPLTTRIVALADRYDLLTQVGGPGGFVQAPVTARDLLAANADADLLRALDSALARVRADEPTS